MVIVFGRKLFAMKSLRPIMNILYLLHVAPK